MESFYKVHYFYLTVNSQNKLSYIFILFLTKLPYIVIHLFYEIEIFLFIYLVFLHCLLHYYNRLNCSFNPLTFTKLRFWSPMKKKLLKWTLKFCICSSFGPQGKKNKKKHVAPHLGCHVSVDKVKIDIEGQNCHKCKA